MSPLTMPMQHEDYNIKNELDNDFMSPHIMGSPIRNDYSGMNNMPHMYNRGMMMQPMQDSMGEYGGMDPSHMKYGDHNMANGFHKPEVLNDQNSNYVPIKEFNEMLHDIYQKPNEKVTSQRYAKNDIEDSGLASPHLTKNNSALGGEPFSPAIYMNTQNVPSGLSYLHNIEDLVNDRN